MKDGELFDARLEPIGWRTVAFDDGGWKHVRAAADGAGTLIASRSVPVRGIEHFEGKVIRVPNGDLVVDFGQNIAGFVKMKLRGCKAGQTITIAHGETLDHGGNFTMVNIAGPGFTTEYFQQVTYIAEGPDEVLYAPLFSIFGFRYIRIEGYDRELMQPGDFFAVAVYSALDETGDFVCSNPLINKLVSNSRWSQKGNIIDVPTDCPTRERGPYTGDSQVYLKTATLFMMLSVFEKWMLLYSEQFPSGKVACIIPNVFIINNPEEYKRVDALLGDERKVFSHSMPKEAPDGEDCLMDSSAGWGDAAVINPYILYLCYGDRQILENQYLCAKKWVDYMDVQAQVHTLNCGCSRNYMMRRTASATEDMSGIPASTGGSGPKPTAARRSTAGRSCRFSDGKRVMPLSLQLIMHTLPAWWRKWRRSWGKPRTLPIMASCHAKSNRCTQSTS